MVPRITIKFLEKQVTSRAQILRRRMEKLPHGQSTRRFQQVSRLVQLTELCMEGQLPLWRKPTSQSMPTTQEVLPHSFSIWELAQPHLARSNTSQRTIRGPITQRLTLHRNSSIKLQETVQPGKLLTSTAALATVAQDFTWTSLLATPSTSRPPTEAQAPNSGAQHVQPFDVASC